MHNEDTPAAGDPPPVPGAPQRGMTVFAGGALEPPAPPPSAPAPPRGRSWALGIACLALLLCAGGGAAGYFAVRHLGALQQAQAQRMEEFAAALAAARQRGDEIVARLARLENDLPVLTAELAQVEESRRRDAQQRIEPADVERLLRMANDSLQLAGDSVTAQHALRLADQRLQALSDPLFAGVRRELAREITALAAVPRPDIAGMAYTLGSLQEELEALPLRHGSTVSPGGAGTNPEPAGTELPRWRAVLRALWSELKSLVVVRRGEGPSPLTPDGHALLTQNLHLKLQTARIALFGRDDRNFHADLAAVQAWLHEYYDAGSAPVAAMSARLREMEQVDIAPPLPDISASLRALQTALERRRGGGA